MKRNILSVAYVSLMMLLLLISNTLYAQVTADIGVQADYLPSNFTSYSTTPVKNTTSNGTFQLVIQKSGAAVPANNFSIIVALSSGVAYTGEAFTVPTGFTFTQISSSSLVFKQTGIYTGSGLSALRTIDIPVQATVAIPAGVAPNWSVQVQQDDLGYQDNQPGNDIVQQRVTVAATPLPVTLISFNVIKENNTANLSWSTSSEVNSSRFEIQQSIDAKQWKVVGTVASNQNSAIKQNYTFNHNNPSAGDNYYRLKMIDNDETFAFSTIKTLSFDQALSLTVYPNPVSDELKLDIKDWSNVKKIQIYNLNGSVVYDAGVKVSDKINVQNLSSGVYLMNVAKVDGTFQSAKFVINR